MARERLVETIRKIRVALTDHDIARAKNLLSELECDVKRIHDSAAAMVHTSRADLSVALNYLDGMSGESETDP